MLQQLKTLIRDQLQVPPWLALMAVGCLAHALVNIGLRKPLASPWGLFGPLVLGVALECYEIWHQYRDIGLWAPGNDPVLTILARHSLDVVKMLAAPAALVLGHLTLRGS